VAQQAIKVENDGGEAHIPATLSVFHVAYFLHEFPTDRRPVFENSELDSSHQRLKVRTRIRKEAFIGKRDEACG
ncbi:uncharacterized, partial [Tachysurus ichikawai]